MSEIRVRFAALETAQGDIAAAASRISGQLEDLKRFLAPMVATWEGQAATEYQARQRQWDTAAGNLAIMLGDIGRTVGAAHAGYLQRELENVQRWR